MSTVGAQPGAHLPGVPDFVTPAVDPFGSELRDVLQVVVLRAMPPISSIRGLPLCGHKTRKSFDRYSIVSERDRREGVGKLAAQAEREGAATE